LCFLMVALVTGALESLGSLPLPPDIMAWANCEVTLPGAIK